MSSAVGSVNLDRRFSDTKQDIPTCRPSLIFTLCARFFPAITSSQETCVLRRERKQSYSVCTWIRPKPTLSLPSFRSYRSPAFCFIFQLFASLSPACLYMSPFSPNPVALLSNILLWLGTRGRQKEGALFVLLWWTLLDVCQAQKWQLGAFIMHTSVDKTPHHK